MRIFSPLSKRLSEPINLGKLFVILSFAVILIAWFALILTIGGVFYKAILLPLILLTFASAVFLIAKYKSFERPSQADIFALAIVLFFAIFNTVYFHDTFLGGRDDGSYANHSIYLARNHDLEVDEYHEIALSGLVKVDGHFTTERYPGYISWIALHSTFLGAFGIRVSNFLLIIIGLMSLYLIGKKLKNSKAGVATVLMFATTFPMLWFTRRTFSEIFLLALIWFGILCFIKAYEEKQANYLIPTFFAFGLALASRIETAAILLMLILLLIFLRFRQKREIFPKKLIVLIVIAMAPSIYWSVASPVGQDWLQLAISRITIVPSAVVREAVTAGGSTLRSNLPSFVFNVFSKYCLHWQLFFIPLALIGSFLRKDKKLFKYLLFIFIIIMPTFVYLRLPHVTYIQPWFLRRYISTIFPFAFLCVAILLFELVRDKRLLASVMAAIIVINVIIASPILVFRDNDGMLKNVESLCRHFSDEDLVLVDRYVTDAYKLANPMFFVFGKHALWLDGDSSDLSHWGFQIGYYDIKTVVDFSDYNKVYIVTSPDLSRRYSVIRNGDATLVFEQDVTNRFLVQTVDVIHLPDRPPDYNDIEYARIKPLIKRPSEIATRHYHIQVYEVNQ